MFFVRGKMIMIKSRFAKKRHHKPFLAKKHCCKTQFGARRDKNVKKLIFFNKKVLYE